MAVWKPWRQEPEAAGQSASACRKKRAMEAGAQLLLSTQPMGWRHTQSGWGVLPQFTQSRSSFTEVPSTS